MAQACLALWQEELHKWNGRMECVHSPTVSLRGMWSFTDIVFDLKILQVMHLAMSKLPQM